MDFLNLDAVDTVYKVPTMYDNTASFNVETYNGVPLTYTLKAHMHAATFILTVTTRHTLSSAYTEPLVVAVYEMDNKVKQVWKRLDTMANKAEAKARETALASIRKLLE